MKDITLSTINEFSRLEIVLFVKEKLLAQNARSVSFDGRCRYRGENGLKCAVGHCITDDEYDEKMELTTINSVFFNKFNIARGRRALLNALQDIHDIHNPAIWRDLFEELEMNVREWEQKQAKMEKQS